MSKTGPHTPLLQSVDALIARYFEGWWSDYTGEEDPESFSSAIQQQDWHYWSARVPSSGVIWNPSQCSYAHFLRVHPDAKPHVASKPMSQWDRMQLVGNLFP